MYKQAIKRSFKSILPLYHRHVSQKCSIFHAFRVSEPLFCLFRNPPSIHFYGVFQGYGNKLTNPMRFSSGGHDYLLCYNEFKKLRKSGNVLVIDVRTHEETCRTGTIPGSICIPAKEFESAINMSPEIFKKTYCRPKPGTFNNVVFVCRRGPRSYKAMLLARRMGFENAMAYKGGFVEWFDQERIKREKKAKRTKIKAPDKH